jgi:hypothetical protein
MRKLHGRLTYANVVATFALFVALGGASYAALKLPKNSVGARELKKNAVSGAKVKKDSLTGSDINEATLGIVPRADSAEHAATADHAASADHAGTAGNGASRIDYNRPRDETELVQNATAVPILNLGELTLSAKCFGTNASQTRLNFYAVSAQAAEFNVSFISQYNGSSEFPQLGEVELPANETREVFYLASALNDWERGIGNFVYRTDGRVISITLRGYASELTKRCQVNGVAIPAS